MGSSVLFPATSVTGVRWSRVQVKGPRFRVRASLDTNVSDMSVKEPEHYRGPKLKVAIIGAGLAGMSTAVELLDQGHEVDIYELRSFIGGKVASFVGKHGNHIEISLHVFFGCCNNLFRLTKKVGADENLLMKDHTHKFVNKGGEIGELDFRFPIGAPLHGIRAFLSTNQLKTYDKSRNAIALALSPVVKALLDPDGALFVMLKGSPDVYLSGPIRKYITDKWGRCVLTPGDPYMPLPNDEIIRRVAKQDYIDRMEGATLSGRQASGYICNAGEELVALRKQLAAFESLEQMEASKTANDELSLVWSQSV
ncbi:Zeta-carotene desaturase /chromoplastic [Citrus sinensis]|uniref:Zeta-carotene desaturase /chromoplastic n=1 Tax=Citrus sinensis TaxID=2711 RepID=A0ACB8KIH3_CITSI|nr:Zeta-carotene desaturase /chromoplastic [Citrus sinensis]